MNNVLHFSIIVWLCWRTAPQEKVDFSTICIIMGLVFGGMLAVLLGLGRFLGLLVVRIFIVLVLVV